MISVITITRGRMTFLPRMIASVAAQRGDLTIEHLIVVDDCDATAEALAWFGQLPSHVRWWIDRRTQAETSGQPRSATLRNRAVAASAGGWVAFIDDDNLWDPDHLASLHQHALLSKTRAVHSWSLVYYRNGAPYIEERDPWIADDSLSRQRYKWLVSKGVRIPGSNEFRSRADPLGTADPVRTVDTGEWLLRKDLLLECPVPTEFSDDELADMVGEDDKLLAALVAQDEPIACSERPSQLYFLGGYSNSGSITAPR